MDAVESQGGCEGAGDVEPILRQKARRMGQPQGLED
jgi:hypothetical protein